MKIWEGVWGRGGSIPPGLGPSTVLNAGQTLLWRWSDSHPLRAVTLAFWGLPATKCCKYAVERPLDKTRGHLERLFGPSRSHYARTGPRKSPKVITTIALWGQLVPECHSDEYFERLARAGPRKSPFERQNMREYHTFATSKRQICRVTAI